jgi:hypothetical protein
MFTWLPMPQFPSVPDEFVQQARELAVQKTDNANADRYNNKYLARQLKKDGAVLPSRYQHGILLGTDWEQWVQQNIMKHYHSTGVRISAGPEQATVHGAHVDGWIDNSPTYKLYYLIDPGGDDVRTVFYREQGHAAERYSAWGDPTRCDDYNNLVEIDSVKFPEAQWILLNTGILHGVENITGLRVNLTVVFESSKIELLFNSIRKQS